MSIVTFNRPPFSYFWFSVKMILVNVAHSLKICKNPKLRGLTLTGENFAFTLEVETSAILELLKLRD
jgi:hypothetical protein